MPQKAMAETGPFRRALDQSGDVRHDKCLVVPDVDDSKIWLQRRKWVIGDLWLRRGYDTDQCRLAGIRESDETDIGDDLQLELKLFFFSRAAGVMEFRSLPGRRREMGVSPTPLAALCNQIALAGLGEVEEKLFRCRVVNLGSDGQPNRDRFTILARSVRALAVAPAVSLVFRVVAKM